MKRIKYLNAFIIILCVISFSMTFVSCSKDEKKETKTEVIISGNWNLNMRMESGMVKTVVQATTGKIENRDNKTSGTLKLHLYLTTSKYYGGTISGYDMANYVLGTLKADEYYYDVIFSGTESPLTVGRYYISMVLTEKIDGQYYVIDYLNFDDTIDFTRTKSSSNGNVIFNGILSSNR